MLDKLNEKERQILDFLNTQIAEKGYPPSVREICSAIGFKSTSTVHAYLERLEKLGFIHKDATKPRALRVVETHFKQKPRKVGNVETRGVVHVPVVGKVTAGQPILAVENIEDTFPVPEDFTQNAEVFMLRIQGESMIEAGIHDKDLVLVKQQTIANNGDIVVAMIEDEATVKVFYKEKDHVRLQPRNPYMEPIVVKNNVAILGKVIGVYRKI